MLKQLLQRLTTVLIGIVMFFVIGEIGYRAYIEVFKPLHQPSTISGLLWEPTPSADVIEDGVRHKINSKGLRDYEYAVEKGKDVFRIAVVGDSVTWGYTELPDTYPKIMERELKRYYPGKKIEVLNFGIGGTDSQHHLAILKEKVLQYAPDVVVVGYCLNDIRFSSVYDKQLVMWFLQRFNLADFVAVKTGETLWRLHYGTGPEGGDKYYREHLGLYEDHERISRLRRISREVKLVLDERGSKLAVVIFPFRQQFDSSQVKPQETVKAICKEEGIPVLDILPQLKDYNKDKLYIEGDFIHFSSFGNEIVGRSIMDFLISKGLLEQSP